MSGLVDPTFTRQYFMGRAIEIEPKVGGRFRLVMEDGQTDTEGLVKAWEPPRRLTMTWNVVWIPEFRNFPEAVVTYELKTIGGMVKLTMTEEHSTPIEEKYLEGARQGWRLILSGLKTLLETGKPLPKFEPKTLKEMK
ncbi:MAG TPA: SRPBCC domain-containing protein [Dongiaceae bacterium]|nr:SRPBCC domain-containing protein [Dongiaceae bacterium]